MAEKPAEDLKDKPASTVRKRKPAGDAKAAPKPDAKPSAKAEAASAPTVTRRRFRRAMRWMWRGLKAVTAFYAFLIVLFAIVPPPINLYQLGEAWRLGGIEKDWVSWQDIAPVMGRAAVAAEDANFCNHWGFDIAAIREEIAQGGSKGRSTLTQQTVKNVFLWQGRSWLRKAMEAVLTPVVELVWTKQRILEVYLNVAEFGEGVFGVQAAAQLYFGVDAKDLTAKQAARLAAVLPNPKEYNAGDPGPFVRKRAGQVLSGAETIKADGRSACFDRD